MLNKGIYFKNNKWVVKVSKNFIIFDKILQTYEFDSVEDAIHKLKQI
jgi:hypothetical protein